MSTTSRDGRAVPVSKPEASHIRIQAGIDTEKISIGRGYRSKGLRRTPAHLLHTRAVNAPCSAHMLAHTPIHALAPLTSSDSTQTYTCKAHSSSYARPLSSPTRANTMVGRPPGPAAMSFTGLGSRRESPCLSGYAQSVSFPNACFAAKSPAYMRDVGEEPYFWAQNDEVCVHWHIHSSLLQLKRKEGNIPEWGRKDGTKRTYGACYTSGTSANENDVVLVLTGLGNRRHSCYCGTR